MTHTLDEYGRYLRSRGKVAVATAGGRQLWVPGARGELVRLPSTTTDAVAPEDLRRLLATRGTWIVTRVAEPGPGREANCYFYLCRDAAYDLGRLRKNARRVIKRGQRHFVVRPCTWDEMARCGRAAAVDTGARHGQQPSSEAAFREFVELRRDGGFHEAWGAWAGDQLAAWLTVLRIDDWAMFDAAESRTEFLPMAPNNVLRFQALRTLLVDERRSVVTTGLSSADATVDTRSMHQYFTRLGFEAVPRCREFLLHPLLRPAFGLPLVSLAWDRVAAAWPRVAVLQKAAGLARHLAKRARLPSVDESTEPPGGEGDDAA
jgi:hypothetical protein